MREGVRMAPPSPLTFFWFELFDVFFRACRQLASDSMKIIENLQFAVQVEVFPENTFLPYHHASPTLGSVA